LSEGGRGYLSRLQRPGMSSSQLESEHLRRVCGNNRRVSRVAVTMSLYMKIASGMARYDSAATAR
jgi:hypothetical protein